MKFYTRLDRPSRIYWSAAFETAPLYRRRKSARIDRSLSQTTLLWWRINATVYIYIPICLQPARKNSSQKRWPSYHFCLCGNLVKVDFPRNPSRTKPNCLLSSTDKEVAFLKLYKWRWMLGHTCRHLRANSPSSSSRSASVRRHQIGLQGPSTSHL